MRLAFDATPLLGHRTGIGTAAAALLERFAVDPDLDVVAFGVTWRGRRALAEALPRGVVGTSRPMAARPLRSAWKRWSVPPIEWWTGAVDVAYSPNYVVPPTRGAAVVTVHDLTPLHHPEMCSPDTLAYPALIRRAVRDGAWIHTISASVADEVRETFDVDPERVVPIHLGAAATASGHPEQGRRLAGADEYVLALGTIEPRKDHPTLVRAFEELAAQRPGLRLVVAGPDGWGTAAFEEALAAAAHRDRVVRLGWVTDEQRADLLAGAAVFAYPSRYEGMGLPPLEAMEAGTPVVATRAGAIPEVVGDAAVLVGVGDPDALAEAIGSLLDDEDRRRVLVAAGRRRRRDFSWESCATGLTSLFRRAANDGSGG